MRVVVDGMGGDLSPFAIVEGSVMAVNEYGLSIIITGPKQLISKELEKYRYNKSLIEIVDADEVISPNEHPVKAIRNKKNSSLNKAINLVKDGTANALVSAGSTGAVMVGSKLFLKMIAGIDRPALAPILPGTNGNFMVIDVGANADCKPFNLVQFALMGKVYTENVLEIKNPTIGLINIGAEEEKGNELTKATYKLLKESGLNFIGNVEPRDISSGNVNVLVCDGFVGNTVLKMYEGVAENIFSILKNDIMSNLRSKIGGLLLAPVFRNFKKKFDSTEVGGAVFLGVNGICIKAHGSSNAKAFKNAIHQATILYDNKIIEKIKSEIEILNSKDAE